MFDQIAEQPLAVTLYTDSYVVRGIVTSRHRRLTDILNSAPEAFIVLSDVTMDEWGTTTSPVKADFAQVNLASVLFATADDPAEATPELRMKKIPEQAFVSVPPFRIIGTVHLPPEANMRLALGELVGRFLPVTDATFWSDTVGAPKERAAMIAVNHARAQILAPHTDVDLWVGLDRSAGRGTDTPVRTMARAASESIVGSSDVARDPWGGAAASSESTVAGPAPAEPDPWGMSAAPDPWGLKAGAAPAPAPAPVPAAPVPSAPSVPPSRTGLLGRVHGTGGSAIELPRPVDEPDGWRGDDR